jgi:uncharacterized membrane protein
MMPIILKWTIRLLIFLITYTIGSRIVSIPMALALKFPRFIVLLMVFILDVLQIPMFFQLYDKGFPRIPLINKLLDMLPTKEKVENSAVGRKAQKLGSWGIIFISAVPTFGGGIWSAVLVAHILHLSTRRSFVYIAIGSLISCLALVYGFDWIFRFLGVLEI